MSRRKSSDTEKNKTALTEMLGELDDSFKVSGGGGMSFLQAGMDKHGNHWAEHPTMEALFCLGIGLDLVEWCVPRELWGMCPGGVPYVQVKV